MKLIEVNAITKFFGGLRALDNVQFHVNEKEILGIIGPNGAGKTTLYNVISGVYKVRSGRVIFSGEDITGLAMNQIARRGLLRTFQANSLFRENTTLDNVLLGYYLQRKAGWASWLLNTRYAQEEEDDIQSRATKIIQYMGLGEFKQELAKNLPHGKQRALGISIALVANPDLLLLDEPVTGMNPVETAEMVRLLNGLREKGLTLMVIEHDMAALMSIADRIVVLNHGVKIAEGMPHEIRANKDVIDAYLGIEE